MNTQFTPVETFMDRARQRQPHDAVGDAAMPNLQQWLQYWNDEESYVGNLRNFQHWLNRARTEAG